MAVVPIEILDVTSEYSKAIQRVIEYANDIQQSFKFQLLERQESQLGDKLNRPEINTARAMDHIDAYRKILRGFHPFVLTITDSFLYNDYSNIFGSSRAKKGLGILTLYNVPDVIIPQEKIDSYLLYYFARYALAFMNPGTKNHPQARGCLYDQKIRKVDILLSFKANSFCDECLCDMIESEDSILTTSYIESVNSLLSGAEKIIKSIADENFINAQNNLAREFNIDELIALISSGNSMHACEKLIAMPTIDEETRAKAILISSQLKNFERDLDLTLILDEKYRVGVARLTKELINTVNNLNT